MGEPQPDFQLIDPSNRLLNQTPSVLTTGRIQTPMGDRGVITIRTDSATLTVMLAKPELMNWIKSLQEMASQMSGLAVATVPLPAFNGKAKK